MDVSPAKYTEAYKNSLEKLKCLYKMFGIEDIVFRVSIYIYIYNVLFSPVKPESGIIPSRQKIIQLWTFKFPGKELNVTDITEQ